MVICGIVTTPRTVTPKPIPAWILHAGIRVSKLVNGVKHTYVYASGKLLRETYGSNTLDFFYSTSGQPYALKHNGTIYYYITNLQGDVMSIVDGTGAVVAEYEYDPYGNIISATGELAETNPLRYRGYVYDQQTDLYYLQSRYYDPSMGRFLNADSYASTGQGILGQNMFAYCLNNPVRYFDPSGKIPFYDYLSETIEQAIESIMLLGEKQKAGMPSIFAKTKKTLNVLVDNFSLDVGFGNGMLLGFDISCCDIDIMSAQAGVYHDVFRLSISNGEVSVTEHTAIGAEASLFFFEVGGMEEKKRAYQDTPAQWVETSSSDTMVTYGSSAYFFAGGTFSVGYDFYSAVVEIVDIWKE